MKDIAAVGMLSALAHEHRIRIFRLLVRAGPLGVTSSDIAEAVGLPPTGASFHLKELERAGLIVATRQGRYIRYAISVTHMRQLLEYLTEDCCQGQPELCGKAFNQAKTALLRTARK
jgi:ArsR family transcriptional regulator, arsenate/arsenite/antimonite-responsive transcriptional repressor